MGEEISGRARWERDFAAAQAAGQVRDADFSTLSGDPVDPVYGPAGGAEAADHIGWPGEFPFTRGLYPTGYRGRPVDDPAVRRVRQRRADQRPVTRLLAAGGGGLSVAFDMPTLMGRDSDDALALRRGRPLRGGHRFGRRHGGAVRGHPAGRGHHLDDDLRAGRADLLRCTSWPPSGRASTSSRLDGTLQTDIFKEYIAQKEWMFRPEPHLRLIGDLMECTDANMPRYKPLSVSGYHIREAGSTAAQELAFTLADGFGYVELGSTRGLDVDEFAPGLSFFFDAHIDFFEEIAKFRAARRIWARWMRDVYGATHRTRPVAAVPHPDRRGLPDRAAAGQQRRPHRDRGAGRGAGRARTRCTPMPWTRCWRCPARRPRRSRCAPSR